MTKQPAKRRQQIKEATEGRAKSFTQSQKEALRTSLRLKMKAEAEKYDRSDNRAALIGSPVYTDLLFHYRNMGMVRLLLTIADVAEQTGNPKFAIKLRKLLYD